MRPCFFFFFWACWSSAPGFMEGDHDHGDVWADESENGQVAQVYWNILSWELGYPRVCGDMAQENTYDSEANLTILKLNQFNLSFFQTTATAPTQTKALSNLPYTDLTMCTCMTDQKHQWIGSSDTYCTSGTCCRPATFKPSGKPWMKTWTSWEA